MAPPAEVLPVFILHRTGYPKPVAPLPVLLTEVSIIVKMGTLVHPT